MQPLNETPTEGEIQALLIALCARYRLTPAPRLEWSQRMVKTLGFAYPTRNVIRLSAWLDPEQAQSTLRHELAHIAAAKDGAKRPHGSQWQRWAKELGAPPMRSSSRGPVHALDKKYSHPMWGLECPQCGLRLARQRVKKGLYHRDCGPKAGHLVRSVKDTADHVFAWVLQAIDETKAFELT